jgi:hypothetical protein
MMPAPSLTGGARGASGVARKVICDVYILRKQLLCWPQITASTVRRPFDSGTRRRCGECVSWHGAEQPILHLPLTFGSTAVCKLNFCGHFCVAKTTKRRLTNCRAQARSAGAALQPFVMGEEKHCLRTELPFPCTRLNYCCRCRQQTFLLATHNAKCVATKLSSGTGTTLRTLKYTESLKVNSPNFPKRCVKPQTNP